MEGVDSLFTAEETTTAAEETEQAYQLATIGEVFDDGVTLIFDGETEAGEKHYKANTSATLEAGQRVAVQAIAGSYVVMFAIGEPNSVGGALPTGGSIGQVLTKSGTDDYAATWATPSKQIPSGGTDGQMLVKNGTTDYSLKWADAVKNYIPTGGSDGQFLTKNGTTNYSLEWSANPIPTGGSDGQVLTKNGSTNYSVKWSDAAKNYIPTSGSDGQFLVKSGSSNYSLEWASNPLPTGGSDGQVLTKNGASNYSVKWATVSPTVAKLTSSYNTLTLNSKVLTPSGTGFEIGTSSYPVKHHASSILLYYSSYKYCTLACNSSGVLTMNGTAVS